MVPGLYTKERSSMKFKIPKMPKIKMPDVVGKAKSLGKGLKDEMGSKTKGAIKGVKNLNPFKK